MSPCTRFSLPLVAALLACSPAQADGPAPSFIDSVYGGVSIHDVVSGSENGLDGNLELRVSPRFGKGWTIKVLPTIGGSVSLNGKTNTAYLGGTARAMLTESFFVEGFLGLSVHDADTPTQRNGANLGCPVLFREGAGVGYRIDHHALSLYWSHISHGGILCDAEENEGLTTVGVRYGYHF